MKYFVILTLQNNDGRRTYAGPFTGRTRQDLFCQALKALGADTNDTVVFFSAEPNEIGGDPR